MSNTSLFVGVIEAYVRLGEVEGIKSQRQVLVFLNLMLETKEKMILEREAKK